MQNVEICLSGEWFEAINVSSHNVGGLFFCTIKHSALAVQNNLVSVDVLIPQGRIRWIDFVKKTITFESDEQQRISIQPAKVLLKQWMDHVSHEAKILLKQSDTNKISDRNVLKQSQGFSKLTQVLTSNHISDTVKSGEESGESGEDSSMMTLSKNIDQKGRPVTNTASLWNLGKVEAYHYCLDRMYTRSSEKKHWFRHAKRALPLDTYDTCVKDLLIEPLKDLFDDFLIAELISFLVVPLYFQVDFVETYRAKGKSEFLWTREVMFWSYECHNTAKEILRSIWKALYESKCKKFNPTKWSRHAACVERDPFYYDTSEAPTRGETFSDFLNLPKPGEYDLPNSVEYKMVSKAPWLLRGKTDLLYKYTQRHKQYSGLFPWVPHGSEWEIGNFGLMEIGEIKESF